MIGGFCESELHDFEDTIETLCLGKPYFEIYSITPTSRLHFKVGTEAEHTPREHRYSP
jgi:hypothetical protein